FPGIAAFVPTFGTAVLIYLGKNGQESVIASGLSLRPMVGIGLISYSLYLVHWPIIVFARYVLLRNLVGWEIGAAIALAFVLAYGSYRFIDRPFSRPRSPISQKQLFTSTAAVLAGMSALGIIGVWTGGAAFLHPHFAQVAE